MYYGVVVRAFLKRLAKFHAEEWEYSYPTLRCIINARMRITLVRANRYIRGSLQAICHFDDLIQHIQYISIQYIMKLIQIKHNNQAIPNL